jgi:hypothetical protein
MVCFVYFPFLFLVLGCFDIAWGLLYYYDYFIKREEVAQWQTHTNIFTVHVVGLNRRVSLSSLWTAASI